MYDPFNPEHLTSFTMGSIGNIIEIEADVVIIGGGFSGLYAVYRARQLGLSVKLIEAGSDYGGTWHWVLPLPLPTSTVADFTRTDTRELVLTRKYRKAMVLLNWPVFLKA